MVSYKKCMHAVDIWYCLCLKVRYETVVVLNLIGRGYRRAILHLPANLLKWTKITFKSSDQSFIRANDDVTYLLRSELSTPEYSMLCHWFHLDAKFLRSHQPASPIPSLTCLHRRGSERPPVCHRPVIFGAHLRIRRPFGDYQRSPRQRWCNLDFHNSSTNVLWWLTDLPSPKHWTWSCLTVRSSH